MWPEGSKEAFIWGESIKESCSTQTGLVGYSESRMRCHCQAGKLRVQNVRTRGGGQPGLGPKSEYKKVKSDGGA